jgi:hypothetical protein
MIGNLNVPPEGDIPPGDDVPPGGSGRSRSTEENINAKERGIIASLDVSPASGGDRSTEENINVKKSEMIASLDVSPEGGGDGSTEENINAKKSGGDRSTEENINAKASDGANESSKNSSAKSSSKESITIQPLTEDIYIELNFYKFLYIFNYMLNTISKKQLYSIYQLDTKLIDSKTTELNIINSEPNYEEIKKIKNNIIIPIFKNTTKNSEVKGRSGFSDIDNIIMAIIIYCFNLKLNLNDTTKETEIDETSFEIVQQNTDKILYMLHAMIINYNIFLQINSTNKVKDRVNISADINQNINETYIRWKVDPEKRKYFKYHH